MSDCRRCHRVPWHPPMMIFAGVGVLFGSFILTLHFNPNAKIPIGAAQIIAAIGLGFYATAGEIREAAAYVKQLGLRGFSRPRAWFELARLAWMLLLFLMATVVVVGLLLAWPQPGAGNVLSTTFAYLLMTS